MRERDIFIEALQRESHAEREACVVSACAGDAELRRRVEELLAEHHNQESFFLDGPPPGVNSTLEQPMAARPGVQIGPYKLLQQIGEGGFGVVFMAEQTAPVRRKVALKVIKPGMDTRQVIARFEAERQALAVMDHPNIARVLDAGAVGVHASACNSPDSPQEDTLKRELQLGRPYFVMELVRGVPITAYCDENHVPVRERLELFASVCQAIQHAHTKGIIHRDIKPTNVLVTRLDGRPVVKVIDFGIAKAMGQQLTEKTLFTEFAQMIGTPLYMSPEQAELTSVDIDTRSDIYSLGVLLYELLTGTTPVDKEALKLAAFDEIRRIIREDEPPRPSTRLSGSETLAFIAAQRHIEPARLSKLVRGELDWIVMKCLEKDRNRRYDTASSLAADVRRYLDNEAVQACPPSARYRFRKFARRHKAALATASVVGVAVLLAVAALATGAFMIAREQRITAGALDDANHAKENLRQDSYFHRIALAQRELSENNLDRALQYLNDCPKDLRKWEWFYLMRLCRVDPVILRDPTEINSIAFSPDGKRLASAGGDGKVKVWNSEAGELIHEIPAHAKSVLSVAFHPDGEHLASVGADLKVKVWNVTTSQPLFEEACDAISAVGTAYNVAFSPDGRCLAVGNEGIVKLWDWRSNESLHAFAGHPHKGISVAFSHDGRRLATGGWQGSVQLWSAEGGGEPLCAFPDARHAHHPISAVAFSRDGRRLATSSFGRRVDVWDTATGALALTIPHRGMVLCVAFSRDGQRLVSADDKTVHVWDAATGREVLALRGHAGLCGCVAFSPDGQRLASAGKDGAVRIWDAAPLKEHERQESLTFSQHTGEIWSLAVCPDRGKPHAPRIVSGGWNMPIKVWDADTGQVTAEFNGHESIVFCVAWSPDGERIASAGGDGATFSVNVWNAQTKRRAFVLPPGPQEYYTVAFSPDGRYLVTGGANRAIQVWDAATGKLKGEFGAHQREVRGIVFSRDGRRLVSASGDGELKLWDATRISEVGQVGFETEKVVRPLPRAWSPGPCLNVAFSPDGERLAIACENSTVKLLEVESGRELHTLWGHSGDIFTVAFSPDPGGRWLASAGEDSTVKIWDSHAGGAPVRSFRGHTGLVRNLAFTADGLLVSGSRDGTVKIWDLKPLNDLKPLSELLDAPSAHASDL